MPPKILNINLFCGLAIFINSSLFCHHIERMICYRMAFSISNLQVLCELFQKNIWLHICSLKGERSVFETLQDERRVFSTLQVFFFLQPTSFFKFHISRFRKPPDIAFHKDWLISGFAMFCLLPKYDQLIYYHLFSLSLLRFKSIKRFRQFRLFSWPIQNMIQVKHWDVKQITVFFKQDRSADCWPAPKRPEPVVFFSSFGSTTEMRTHPVKYAQARYCLLESEDFCPLFAPLWAAGILQGCQLKT